MNILVVGNVIKDVYLNLDSRTEPFETDQNGIKWLDLGFNASEHHFFNRNSSLGGAAVSLEVLEKIGLKTAILGTNLALDQGNLTSTSSINAYRYILISDGGVSYLSPTNHPITHFTPPAKSYDYLYLDRSANLSSNSAKKIAAYLKQNSSTKLILYVRDFNNPNLNTLLKKADLIFSEVPNPPELKNFDPSKIIYISENKLTYLDITEHISVGRVDMLTHLSTYSITSATILGCFILGYSVENSLRMARLNIENAKLDSVLPLSELKNLMPTPHNTNDLELTAANLVLKPRGILAADESGGSIHKKFAQLNIADTYDNRRDYRNIFFTTPDLEKHVNGIILFDETARQQADNGQNFVDFLTSRRIIPGIKVDQGLEKFPNSEETYTKGLDGLSERLQAYYQMGLRFAKWRSAFTVHLDEKNHPITPTDQAINQNCADLATYAKTCQENGLVPIVEPELVYDGNYDIDVSANLTAKILDNLFAKLKTKNVNLRACILKVNMVLAGKQQASQSNPEEVGLKTSRVLKDHVPKSLAGVVFLSGGQTPEQATANFAEIVKHGPYPWPVTFSFARALQDPALFAWQGDNHNIEKARQAFLDRLIANTEIL